MISNPSTITNAITMWNPMFWFTKLFNGYDFIIIEGIFVGWLDGWLDGCVVEFDAELDCWCTNVGYNDGWAVGCDEVLPFITNKDGWAVGCDEVLPFIINKDGWAVGCDEGFDIFKFFNNDLIIINILFKITSPRGQGVSFSWWHHWEINSFITCMHNFIICIEIHYDSC